MFSKLHAFQWQFLKKAFEKDKLPHALLFSGPSGVGKFQFALEFCKFILGSIPHPDALFIKPVEGVITIEQIREIKWHMALRPFGADWKITVLEKAHLMALPAQNAFLKTLEEPHLKRLFILISEHPFWLLPTVLSRVQRVVFRPLPKDVLEKFLLEQGASEKESQFIVQFSKGLAGLAFELLRDKEKLTRLKQELNLIRQLSKSDLAEKFAYAKKLAEKSNSEIIETLHIWLFYFHNLFLKEQRISALTSLQSILENLEKTQNLIKFTNVNQRLALETLLLDLHSKSWSDFGYLS